MWLVIVVIYIISVMAARYIVTVHSHKYLPDFGAQLMCILPVVNIMFVVLETLEYLSMEQVWSKIARAFIQRRK